MPRRNQLSRRTLLGGAGALIALPWLEAMGPTRRARGADPMPPPLRALFYYLPCGIHMQSWTPATEGPDFEITKILEPLVDPNAMVDLKSDVLLLTGLANMPAKPEGPGDHAGGTEDLTVQQGGLWTFRATNFAKNGTLRATAVVGGKTVTLSGDRQISASDLGWKLDANGDAGLTTPAEAKYTRVKMPAEVGAGSYVDTPLEITFSDGAKTVKRTVTVEPALSASVTVAASAQIGASNLRNGRDINGPFDVYSQEMFAFIREETPPDSVVIFFRPRAMRLLGERDSFLSTECARLPMGDYLALSKKADDSLQIPENQIQGCGLSLTSVFENRRFIVFRLSQ